MAKSMNEWISVKDRLPITSGGYLVISDNPYKSTCNFEKMKTKGKWKTRYTVTHWTPLPEHSKDGE